MHKVAVGRLDTASDKELSLNAIASAGLMTYDRKVSSLYDLVAINPFCHCAPAQALEVDT